MDGLQMAILNAANTPTADDAVDASAALVNVIDAPVSQLSGRSLASLLVAGSSSSDQAEGASWQEATTCTTATATRWSRSLSMICWRAASSRTSSALSSRTWRTLQKGRS